MRSRPLFGVDVEVVHPEVDQDLVQLPLGLGGAQDARGRQVLEDAPRAALGRDQVAQPAQRVVALGAVCPRPPFRP